MNGAEVLIKFKGETSEAGKSIDGLKSKVSSLASGIAKGLASATAIATASLIALSKKAIESFADYEQLVGGVETLFKDSADIVQQYAKQSYKTAGISANEYMSTITSFSASLLQSLKGDTKKSAEVADRAIRDMADNANKMGTPIENIQSAYQAFAKQNYTLLDNLKLGYGGTRTEMQRLIKDASKMKKEMNELGISVKEGDMSFANMVNAISVVQKHMGITGTTMQEAGETITGSLNMAKASFQDLLTTFATGEGIDEALDNFMSSIETFGGNVIPVIEKVLDSIAKAIPKFVDKISKSLPGLIQNVLPSLIQGAVSLVNGLIQALPTLIQTLLPELINGLVMITEQIIIMLPEIITMIADMLPTLIPTLIDAILQLIPMLLDHLPEIVEAGFQLLVGLVTGLINALPKIFEFGVQLVEKLFEGIKSVIQKIPEFFSGIWNKIGDGIHKFFEGVKQFFKNIIDTIVEIIKTPINWVIDGLNLFIRGLNKIQIPDWVPVVGGKGIHIDEIAHLSVGTNFVPEDMLAMIHKGEAVVPKKFNPYANGINTQTMGAMNNSNTKQVINVYANFETDPLGQVVSTIKTFSGGAKNDYNYGYGGTL